MLRDRRLSRTMTPADVAARLGVHPGSVLRWERRERLPGPAHILGMARLLEVDVNAIAAYFDEARTSAPTSGVRGLGLRAVRRSLGMPATQVAEAAGVHVSTVYNWEAGRALIPSAQLPLLASLTGVPVTQLPGLLKVSAPTTGAAPARSQLWRMRRRTGLSQEVVAQRLGVSRHTVGAWERGEKPPLGAVRRLSEIYGVSIQVASRAAGLKLPELLLRSQWSVENMPEVLRTLRSWCGLRQSDVAARCGCSRDAVRSWERGRAVPSERLGRRLELLYGVPTGGLEDLFAAARDGRQSS